MSAWDEVLLGLAPAPERPAEAGGAPARLLLAPAREPRPLQPCARAGPQRARLRPQRRGRLGAARGAADRRRRRRAGDGRDRAGARGRVGRRPPAHAGGAARRAPDASSPTGSTQPLERRALDLRAEPAVILVVGVNGTGKTTTIGKLAYQLHEAGASVVIGAADTFRAAAAEQLETWAERAQADFVGSASGSDPAAVAFDAVSAGVSRGRRVVIVDTAGRLHTQEHLMEELAEGAPRDRAAAAGAPARDAAHDRRHDGSERAAAGAPVHAGRRGHRARPDEARRQRQGRHRDRDRTRARAARSS